jgi:hypothetical protein
MSKPITAIVLAAALAVSLVTLVAAIRLPGDNQGYEPVQPIAYSHRLHAGELQISCQYCHSGVDKSRHAGIPAMNVCMNCHSGVTATLAAVRQEEEAAKRENRAAQTIESPELRKLYDALATMERVRQYESLSMGWCVNCHRDANENGIAGRQVQAPIDCVTCHY